MYQTIFYILAILGIVVVGFIWIRLLKDNAKQQKQIAKHYRDIARARKSNSNSSASR